MVSTNNAYGLLVPEIALEVDWVFRDKYHPKALVNVCLWSLSSSRFLLDTVLWKTLDSLQIAYIYNLLVKLLI